MQLLLRMESPPVQLEERVEELEQREEAWRRAAALAEDLREQLAARLDHERRLQEELRTLANQARRSFKPFPQWFRKGFLVLSGL
jgi:hypothetical protein